MCVEEEGVAGGDEEGGEGGDSGVGGGGKGREGGFSGSLMSLWFWGGGKADAVWCSSEV